MLLVPFRFVILLHPSAPCAMIFLCHLWSPSTPATPEGSIFAVCAVLTARCFAPFFAACPPFLRAPLCFFPFLLSPFQMPPCSPMCESDDTCFAGTCDIATLFPLPKPFGRRLFFLRNTGKSLLLPPFSACPPLYGGSQASPLRWRFAPCSRLGASHPSLRPTLLRVVGFASAERQSRCPQRSFRFAQPSLRPTPALRAVAGFGAAVLLRSVLTPRCFAPFFRPAPALRRVAGFAAALPRLTSESACVFRSQFPAGPFRRFSAFGV